MTMTVNEHLVLGVSAAVFTALLFRFRRDDRAALLSTCVIAAIGIAMHALAAPALRGGFTVFAGVMQEAGVVLTGIAFIRLLGMFVFRLVLPLLRIEPPRIL